MSGYHLLHPAVVHFAVAFLIAGGLAEAGGLLARRDSVARAGSMLVIAGLLAMVPVIASGYIAANSVGVDAAAMKVLDVHERNAWILLALFVLALFWKSWSPDGLSEGQRPFYAGWLLIAVGFTAYSAWVGGQLVYVHGVGVGVGS